MVSTSNAGAHPTGVSVVAGVGLVFLGVLVNLGAIFQHVRLIDRLRSGVWKPGVSHGAVALAALLAICGAALAVFLLLVR